MEAKLEAEKAQTKVEALRGESGEAAPADELTALSASELRQRCDGLGIDTAGMEKHELVNALRAAGYVHVALVGAETGAAAP